MPDENVPYDELHQNKKATESNSGIAHHTVKLDKAALDHINSSTVAFAPGTLSSNNFLPSIENLPGVKEIPKLGSMSEWKSMIFGGGEHSQRSALAEPPRAEEYVGDDDSYYLDSDSDVSGPRSERISKYRPPSALRTAGHSNNSRVRFNGRRSDSQTYASEEQNEDLESEDGYLSEIEVDWRKGSEVLKMDDDTFLEISSRILKRFKDWFSSRYKPQSKSDVEKVRVVHSYIARVTSERGFSTSAFIDALQVRVDKLPMFPERFESRSEKMVRKVAYICRVRRGESTGKAVRDEKAYGRGTRVSADHRQTEHGTAVNSEESRSSRGDHKLQQIEEDSSRMRPSSRLSMITEESISDRRNPRRNPRSHYHDKEDFSQRRRTFRRSRSMEDQLHSRENDFPSFPGYDQKHGTSRAQRWQELRSIASSAAESAIEHDWNNDANAMRQTATHVDGERQSNTQRYLHRQQRIPKMQLSQSPRGRNDFPHGEGHMAHNEEPVARIPFESGIQQKRYMTNRASPFLGSQAGKNTYEARSLASKIDEPGAELRGANQNLDNGLRDSQRVKNFEYDDEAHIVEQTSEIRQMIMGEIRRTEDAAEKANSPFERSFYQERLNELQCELVKLSVGSNNQADVAQQQSQIRQMVMKEMKRVQEGVMDTTVSPLQRRVYQLRLNELQDELLALRKDGTAGTTDVASAQLQESPQMQNEATRKGNEGQVIQGAPKSQETQTIQQAPVAQQSQEVRKSKDSENIQDFPDVDESQRHLQEQVQKTVLEVEERIPVEKPTNGTFYEVPVVRDMSRRNSNMDNGKKGSVSFSQNTPTLRTDNSLKEVISPRKERIVYVEAPANLPAGYTFEAMAGDNLFLATVPQGGVKKGQTFEFKIEDDVQMYIPLGRWRDGLFQCFRQGICHPMFLNGCFCPHVALAQVMHRMHLNACGNPVIDIRGRAKLSSILVASFSLITLHIIFFLLPLESGSTSILLLIEFIPLALLDLCIFVYFLVLVAKTRHFVRSMYKIDESDVESTFNSVCCWFFAITQMGRHTADYETYRGICCSATGLPDKVQALSFLSLPAPGEHDPLSLC